MSFMKRMNRRALVTLPCGTPLETEQDDDRECPAKYAELLNADKIQFSRVKFAIHCLLHVFISQCILRIVYSSSAV